jgi:hypothetical protein
MAWATPRTWNPGEVVTAALMNQHVRDNMNILKTPLDDSGKIISLTAPYLASLDATDLIVEATKDLFADAVPHTPVTTGEEDASTFTIPGGTLAADGDYLELLMWGKFAGSAGTTTVKVYWNGASIYTLTFTLSAGEFFVLSKIQRSGATAQTAITHGGAQVGGFNTATPANTATQNTVWDSLSATLSGNVILKTALRDTSAGSNITQLGAAVVLHRVVV